MYLRNPLQLLSLLTGLGQQVLSHTLWNTVKTKQYRAQEIYS